MWFVAARASPKMSRQACVLFRYLVFARFFLRSRMLAWRPTYRYGNPNYEALSSKRSYPWTCSPSTSTKARSHPCTRFSAQRPARMPATIVRGIFRRTVARRPIYGRFFFWFAFKERTIHPLTATYRPLAQLLNLSSQPSPMSRMAKQAAQRSTTHHWSQGFFLRAWTSSSL